MASNWSFATFMDWLQGNPPRGSEEESGQESWRRRPRPRPRSIPWRPVDGEDPGELFETGWPDEVFVSPSVFREIRSHLPEHPGDQRYGFLLGRRLVCPATGDPYLLIDQIWAAPDPLRERGGSADFEAALGEARTQAVEGEKDVLGWYHTHSPLMGLQLSEHDVRLHARFFPERWHCALVEVAHGERPVGGLFQRRQRNRYPGTKLISFLEVVEAEGSGPWSEMESQLDWTNYDTPRAHVRRVAPPRDPGPVIRARGSNLQLRRSSEEPVRRAPPAGPSWKWLPLTGSDAGATSPEQRRAPAASRKAAPGSPPETAPPRQLDAPAARRAEPEAPEPARARPEPGAPEPAAAEPATPEPARSRPEPGAPRREPPGRRTPRQPASTDYPFRLEPPESEVAGGSLSRAVDGLGAVIASRRRALEQPAPSPPTEGSAPRGSPGLPRRRPATVEGVAVADIPIVIPPEDESWPTRGDRIVASIGQAWRALLFIPLLGVGLFFLLRADGGGEPLDPTEFHPAAGPAETSISAAAGTMEFERLRNSLAERLDAYNDRHAEYELGRVDCRILSAALRTAQRDFLRLSDRVASEDVSLTRSQRQAWRDLAARTSSMDRRFEATGCDGPAGEGEAGQRGDEGP